MSKNNSVGKLSLSITVVARFLSLCAMWLVLPAIAAAQPTPLVVQRVWMRDAGGNNKTTFAPGETIQFAADLNNSYGGYLLGANGTQLTITTSFYNDTKPVDIPPDISIWTWNTTAPEQGSYTVTVQAYDHFYGTLPEGSASFTVGAEQSQLPPEITRVETFREGDLVFFRLFYTDPNNDAEGFGFRGAKGSLWAEAEIPLSNPGPYGRVSLEQRRIELPFNHLCDTGPAYESDVEAWIYDGAGLRSRSIMVHLACTEALKLPRLPFFFCISGPGEGGGCQNMYENPVPDTNLPSPPEWLTSPLAVDCLINLISYPLSPGQRLTPGWSTILNAPGFLETFYSLAQERGIPLIGAQENPMYWKTLVDALLQQQVDDFTLQSCRDWAALLP